MKVVRILSVVLAVALSTMAPVLPAGAAEEKTSAEAVQAAALVNLNTAGLEELMTLKGIGEKTAEAIVAHRQEHGPFKSVDDLIQVKGVGEKKLEALRPLVTVEK